MPVGFLLVGVSDAQHRRLIERATGDLQADGQLIAAESARDGHGRDAKQVERRHVAGQGACQLHLPVANSDGLIGLADLWGGDGRRGHSEQVDATIDIVHLLAQDGAQALCIHIVDRRNRRALLEAGEDA